MRFTPFLGLILASVAIAQDAKQGPVPSFKTKSFPELQQRVGGSWTVHWNLATNTPDTIYGTGIALADWRGNSIDEARRQANNALGNYGDLLMLGASEYRESIGARMGHAWSFVYDQFFRGLPCIGGRADVRINMRGVIASLGSTAWQIPANFDITPAIGETEAEARAWLTLDQRRTGVPQPDNKRTTRLVIWGDVFAQETAPFYLAWEVPVSNVDREGNGPIGRYYIDAKTGQVLNYTTDKHECGVVGCNHAHHADRSFSGPMPETAIVPTTLTVMAWTRNGQTAVSPLVNIPCAGLVVSVPGVGSLTTDANGQITFDIANPVTITMTALDGRHASPIQDTTGNNPSASVTVTPGVPATLQLLSNAATQEQAAHTSTHFWIDTANEWVRSIVGNVAQMNTADNVIPRVNTTGTCNAFYTGNTVNFYPNGGGCNNTAFSTVVVHEWGHGIDDRFGGISNASGDGLSEGWGDIFGMFHPLVDNPVVGQAFFTTGGAIRTGLNNTLYGTQTEVHAAGEVWMGFAWRLRENLRASLGTAQAIAISNDIVIGSIPANATNQANAVIQVFIADDDDGNLTNGVPHYNELSAAAITKGMPYPQVQFITIAHTALTDTTVRFTPRMANATVTANDAGTITQVRMVYSANGGLPQIRPMVANGSPNGYRALLPGVSSGAVTYHLEATSTTGTARLPASGEFAYTVTAIGGPFTAFFTENFETGAPGWSHGRDSGTATDDWQLGVPNGKTGTSLGVPWQDPSAAVSSNVYGTDLGAGTSNGAYPANMNYWLRAPTQNCAGRVGVTIRFRRWLQVEESTFDHAQLRVNGILVWENPLVGHTQDTSWQTFEYPLPMADNNPSVVIEWRLTTDGGLQMGGWNIDDVEVGTRPLPTVPASLQIVPEQPFSGQPTTLSINTDEPSELFVMVMGDTAGPTIVPPFPTILVGGAIDFLVGLTDGANHYGLNFNAPVGPPGGFLFFTQLLVFEGDGTFTVSNQNQTLFVQ